MKPLIVITGPNAIGKTDHAIALCKIFGGAIVSADSRQVYQHLDVGSGKAGTSDVVSKKTKGSWVVNGVVIYMYDVVPPSHLFTVKEYIERARPILSDLWDKGTVPFVVGGTWLYIKALIGGLDTAGIPPNRRLRRQLERMSVKTLQAALITWNRARFEAMNHSDQSNPRRLMRVIEIAQSATKPTSFEPLPVTPLYIGLTAPLPVLNKRIYDRLISRLPAIIEEVKKARGTILDDSRLEELGMEYRYALRHITGEVGENEMVAQAFRAIKLFATRQFIFMRTNKEMQWLDVTDDATPDTLKNMIERYLTHAA